MNSRDNPVNNIEQKQNLLLSQEDISRSNIETSEKVNDDTHTILIDFMRQNGWPYANLDGVCYGLSAAFIKYSVVGQDRALDTLISMILEKNWARPTNHLRQAEISAFVNFVKMTFESQITLFSYHKKPDESAITAINRMYSDENNQELICNAPPTCATYRATDESEKSINNEESNIKNTGFIASRMRLTDYLEKIRSTAKKIDQEQIILDRPRLGTIGLNINHNFTNDNSAHSIAVSYNPQTDQFSLCDANRLPIKRNLDSKEMADYIFQCYTDDTESAKPRYITLVIEYYINKNQHELLTVLMSRLDQDEEWYNAHHLKKFFSTHSPLNNNIDDLEACREYFLNLLTLNDSEVIDCIEYLIVTISVRYKNE